MNKPYAIHWFRRDLRLDNNPALQKSITTFQGNVICVFCFDKKFLSRDDFSVNRFQFFLETLKELKNEVPLLFLDAGPENAFELLFSKLKTLPKQISWNRDYEPFARERDRKMGDWFRKKGIEVTNSQDHLIVEPDEIVKKSDSKSPFQIYTPYSKVWLETAVLRREKNSKHSFKIQWKDILDTKSLDVFDLYYEKNRKKVTVPIPKAGRSIALEKLRIFKKKIEGYETDRDIPSISGTSHFSIFFKNGSLTTTDVILSLDLLNSKGSRLKFLKELIWREFYYYILYKFPHVETDSFNPKYRKIKWQNNEKYFDVWKNGRTGFPIVDAGMRQLKQTGWMHNRVRMIVASFLTKDLLIDYRWGERYFMEQLLDGDLAPNNGGWQWAASTGCDPQPYFRIFNPTLQSEKFDPNQEYIKKYIPELGSDKYPNPIVDHSEQREKAIKLFKF